MIKTALFAFAVVAATTTSASAIDAYLSHTGTGSTCSFLAPCRNMGLAIAATGSAGGEVICLDKDHYGGAFIDKSVTISCGDGLWEASAGNVSINITDGTDVVIEGLNLIEPFSTTGIGVQLRGQGSLHLHRVRIGRSSSHLVNFEPNGGATLHVSDSVFYNSGGSGIHIRPTGSGYANVHMRNVKFERNGNGLFIDGSASSVGVNVHVTGSVFAENSGNGIGAYSSAGGAGITVSVKDAQISGNLGNGVGVLASAPSGAGSALIEINSSMITGNVYGISASGGGQIRTFGNNQLRLNGNNGAFTGSVGLQ